jgi:fused signal recognition particle receptor
MKRLFSRSRKVEDDSATQTEDSDPGGGGLIARLKRTREGLFGGITTLFRNDTLDEAALEEIEDQLLVADAGVAVASRIVEHLRADVSKRRITDADTLRQSLRDVLGELLAPCKPPEMVFPDGRPLVIMMVGVNGVGKTTTLAKLAARFQQDGRKVMLAACDTFRAAAIEQLQAWGERLDVPVIAQGHGADAAAVAFDAYSAALAREQDVLLVDTAGRQHTHGDLMEQLKKVGRVLSKADPAVPDEVWLTVDAGNGQNVLSQVRQFHEAVHLTGICVTKLDGTARGGVVLALAEEFGLPVRYLGTGESAADLRPFSTPGFIEALLPGK